MIQETDKRKYIEVTRSWKYPNGKLSCTEETYRANIPEGSVYRTFRDFIHYEVYDDDGVYDDEGDLPITGELVSQVVHHYDE